MKFRKVGTQRLVEKYWVQLYAPSDPSIEPFWYYTTGQGSDFAELDGVIRGMRTGSFKQSLDPDIRSQLSAAAKDAGTGWLGLAPTSSKTYSNLPSGATRIITIADRELRREAHKAAAAHLTHLTPKTCLIHHKNGREYDNTPSNLVVIGTSSDCPLIEHAVHKLVHCVGGVQACSVTVPIWEWDLSTSKFRKTHEATLSIARNAN